MKYCVITYGCQQNHSDSERIAAVLDNIGSKQTSNENEADLIVINSCSVRQPAIDRIYGKINDFAKLKIKNEKLKIILTGCVLPADKKKLAGKFDLILDIKNLSELLKKLQQLNNLTIKQFNNRILHSDRDYFQISPKYQSSFSVSVPIMTGCDNFCSYCAVPYTRGREISRPPEEIICEAKNAIKNGAKEIWLLGQNVNSYHSLIRANKGIVGFPELLKMVNDIPGDFWIRFTSPHPKDFSDELIETMTGCEKITPYLNLPLQSGDNQILKKMKRPYTAKHYKNLVQKIRDKFAEARKGLEKNICLSTDIIVGFPGETKKQFENTAKLMKEIKFDMAYISKYSPRPGTSAAKMKDSLSRPEKEKRAVILNEILKKTALENNEKYVGKTMEVLIQESKNGFLTGKSRNYKTVRFQISNGKPQMANLIGNFTKVKITKALPWGLGGKLIS